MSEATDDMKSAKSSLTDFIEGMSMDEMKLLLACLEGMNNYVEDPNQNATESVVTNSAFEFVNGKRGKKNLICDGYRYTLDKKRIAADGIVRSYWRCVVKSCTGRLTLKDATVISRPRHSHSDQYEEILVYKAKAKIKETAATSNSTTRQIVSSALASLPKGCKRKLGCELASLFKMARKARLTALRSAVSASTPAPSQNPPATKSDEDLSDVLTYLDNLIKPSQQSDPAAEHPTGSLVNIDNSDLPLPNVTQSEYSDLSMVTAVNKNECSHGSNDEL